MMGNKGLRVLSLFDGMACGLTALKRAGIAVSEYHAYEIDKYAIQIARKNHPEIIHHGEINFMTDFTQYAGFDLLIGGSPCQGFSAAGKGLNFSDPRSQLFFEFVRAKREMNPRWFLLENVKMKKEWLAIIDEHMGVKSVVINSALVSAQNRVRHYWCNWPVSQPADRGIYLRDIIERDIEPEPETAGWHEWFEKNKEFQLRKGYTKILGEEDKAITMTARQYGSWNGNFVQLNKKAVTSAHAPKFTGGRVVGRKINPETGKRDDYSDSLTAQQRLELREDGKAGCITTVGKDSVLVSTGLIFEAGLEKGRRLEDGKNLSRNYGEGYRIYSPEGKAATLTSQPKGGEGGYTGLYGDSITYRKLTPIECERLQTVPDNYTASVSNTQRYRMLGNGWTIDVIAHIFREMPI